MPASRKFVVKTLENFILIALFGGFFAVPVYLSTYTPRFLWVAGGVFVLVLFATTFFRRGVAIGRGFADFMPVAFIPLSVWAARSGHGGLVTVFSVVMVIVIIGSFVLLHMARMDETLEVMPLSSAAPVRRIISFNYKLMAGLAGLVLVLTLVLFFAVVMPVFGILAEIFPGLPEFVHPERPDMEVAQRPMGGLRDLETPGMLSREQSPVMQIFGLVIRIVFSVFIVVAVAFCGYMIIRAFLKWSGTRKIYYEQMAKDMDAIDEKEFILPIRKKERTQQPDNEIRRRFKAAVKRHIKNGVPIEKSDTPSDMQVRITAEDIGVGEYEQVRYGEIT
ncbi:MAG: hypothetical protein FWB80_04100 [Defluviitaleaceae bacterium]|nr:hypothetical protein [Defluviitaleaceae bacterium]